MILQIVSQSYSHLVAKDIYDECKQIILDISLGSNKVMDYEINFKDICKGCLKKEGEI